MTKCKCYHQHGIKFLCYGTKEMEECSCGGDESKCNFYPEKRNQKMRPKKRLIDANALGIGRCNPDLLPFGNRPYAAGWNGVVNLIENAPTVDAVEVVHGRWEWLGPNRLVPECMCGTCSVCKVRSKYIVNTDICPNCGAKMDGDGNGQ